MRTPQLFSNEDTLRTIAERIVATHHAYIRTSLPSITAMVKDAFTVGSDQPLVRELRDTWCSLSSFIEYHEEQEERFVFNLIKSLEDSDTLHVFHCKSIQRPLGVMEKEHQQIRNEMDKIRELTGDYTPTTTTSIILCRTLTALADFECHLRWHFHDEEAVLFPRAIAREALLASRNEQEKGIPA
jgi:regulator of cell morphogenesis and NO signaling